MTAIEMAVFVGLVVGAALLLIGVVWFVQWRRDPDAFKAWMRRDTMHKGGRTRR